MDLRSLRGVPRSLKGVLGGSRGSASHQGAQERSRTSHRRFGESHRRLMGLYGSSRKSQGRFKGFHAVPEGHTYASVSCGGL